MRILVLAKQVPGSQRVDMDPETGVIKRQPGNNKMNPYDLAALEMGLRLKEQHGGSLDVLTMGPPQAERILYEAYAMGADDGYLLSDRRLGGSDVLATSFALSQAIAAMEQSYDLILCGKQTTDGDTSQVPPAISRWLSLPMASWVKDIAEVGEDFLRVTQDFGTSTYLIKLRLPCVISVDGDAAKPRLPSYKLMKQTRSRPIHTITVDNFAVKDPSKYGLEGSPTRVDCIFPPTNNTQSEIWQGDASKLAQDLSCKLKELKFI